MINYQTNMTSAQRAMYNEMRENERRVLDGPRDAEGRPMPSAFAQACASKRHKDAFEAVHERIVTSLSARKLG